MLFFLWVAAWRRKGGISAVTSVSLTSAGAGFLSEYVIVQILTENLLQT